jgi:hypothetical protein
MAVSLRLRGAHPHFANPLMVRRDGLCETGRGSKRGGMADPEDPIGKSAILGMIPMAVAVFVIANDFTALSAALPVIERTFGTSVDTSQWVINGYAMVFGGHRHRRPGSPTCSGAADMSGRSSATAALSALTSFFAICVFIDAGNGPAGML